MGIQKLYKFWLTTSLAFTSFYCLVGTDLVQAQSITPDATLPTPTEVTPTATGVEITGGTARGINLFHSFQEFSLLNGNEAFFNNANTISNIITRVTGGKISTIDGLISANNANLFFLNPAGILFGPNASLNIGGSFYGSTADSLIFPEGEFSATNPQAPPTLIVNAPIGLGFRDNPGNININRSFLSLAPGETLALIGGNVTGDSSFLDASGGRIELGGLTATGTVSFNDDGSLNFPDGVGRGDVSLTNGSFVNVSSNNGGSVTVNARNLEILGGGGILAGIIPGNQQADVQAGDIIIDATDKITIAGEANFPSAILNVVGDASGPNFSSSIPTQGNSGNILINTDKLEGTGPFLIGSFANGEGNAGSVTVTARQSVLLDGGESSSFIASSVGTSGLGNGADITITTPLLSISNNAGINASTNGQGNAGNISIKAGSLTLENGGNLETSTFGKGSAGNINLDVDGAITLNNNSDILSQIESSAVVSKGEVGTITISASSFSMSGQNSLISTNTFGTGDAGNVFLNVSDNISLNGGNIFSQVGNSGNGNAGNIEVNTTNLSLLNGSQLTAGVFGTGNAGKVIINATDKVLFQGVGNNGLPSGVLNNVAATGIGKAGDIEITTENLTLSDRAQISSNLEGQGNAGDIEINTTKLTLDKNSLIGASTFNQGNAGKITINAVDSISFDASSVFSSVSQTGIGKGGGIEINTPNLALSNDAVIVASTFGKGNAGNITIDASDILIDGTYSGIGSEVSGANQVSGGEVFVTTDNLTVTNGGVLSASTFGQGNGGKITVTASDTIAIDGKGNDGFASGIGSEVSQTAVGNAGDTEINTNNLIISNGGVVTASTFGTGDAGTIKINANDISIYGKADDGSVSGIGSRVAANAQGNAGGIEITTDELSIDNGGQISVNSQGEGQGGSLFIQADNLSLDNESSLLASTPVGNGGNIALEIAEVLSLRGNSLISAEAKGDANGGNVNINAQFVVAFPDDGVGNDIVASAAQGKGGQVTINAQQIFNLEERKAVEGNGTNDIDVSSEAGLEGQVNITIFKDDVLRNASELPRNPVEPEQTVAQACSSQGIAEGGNSFTVTGKGGVPPQPTEPFTADVINIEGTTTSATMSNNQNQQPQGILTSQGYIVPAQGIIKKENGEVMLVGYPVNNINQRTPVQSSNCGKS